MSVKARNMREEKRAYWRLLRHLLSNEVEKSYKNDRPEALPPRMTELIEQLDDHEAKGPPKAGH